MSAKSTKTAAPAVEATDKPAWNREEHFAEVEVKLAQAMKHFPTAGTARDLAVWFHQNRMIGYKNLMRATFAAFNLK
jgi:hypothetical protein